MQKFYTGAPACAPKNKQNFVVGVGSLPVGEAMPTAPVGLPLGILAKSPTPPPPEGGQAAGTADQQGAQASGTLTRGHGFFSRLLGAQERTLSLRPTDADAFRLERFALQSVARKALPSSRTAKCLRIPTATHVAVTYSPSSGLGNYKNLQTCGSVWRCPCCASKIVEFRRDELIAAVNSHRAKGGIVLLVTRTFSHTANDRLVPMWQALSAAEAKYKNGEPWKRIARRYKIEGTVRALEVTVGQHGWHPHLHELVFLALDAKPFDLDLENPYQALQDSLFDRWHSACGRAGLGLPSREYGVDVRSGEDAARYVSKWGMASELTRSNSKVGKVGGLTPFDLLRVALHEPDDVSGRAALALFAEYGQAAHGKRQLVWSKNLRQKLGLVVENSVQEAAKDAEVAAGGVELDAVRLAMIPVRAWRWLIRRELHGPLQQAIKVKKGDWVAAVTALLDRVGDERVPLRGALLEAGELAGPVSWLDS